PRFHHAPVHQTAVSVSSIPWCAHPSESLAIYIQHVPFYIFEKFTHGALRSFVDQSRQELIAALAAEVPLARY
ncbi:MAG: hypothetical protein WCF80_25390, partial [Pseudolabrys sp.]